MFQGANWCAYRKRMEPAAMVSCAHCCWHCIEHIICNSSRGFHMQLRQEISYSAVVKKMLRLAALLCKRNACKFRTFRASKASPTPAVAGLRGAQRAGSRTPRCSPLGLLPFKQLQRPHGGGLLHEAEHHTVQPQGPRDVTLIGPVRPLLWPPSVQPPLSQSRLADLGGAGRRRGAIGADGRRGRRRRQRRGGTPAVGIAVARHKTWMGREAKGRGRGGCIGTDRRRGGETDGSDRRLPSSMA